VTPREAGALASISRCGHSFWLLGRIHALVRTGTRSYPTCALLHCTTARRFLDDLQVPAYGKQTSPIHTSGFYPLFFHLVLLRARPSGWRNFRYLSKDTTRRPGIPPKQQGRPEAALGEKRSVGLVSRCVHQFCRLGSAGFLASPWRESHASDGVFRRSPAGRHVDDVQVFSEGTETSAVLSSRPVNAK